MATVFVGNLPPNVTESKVRALFETHGKVLSVRLLHRRGTAYVELDPDTADAAVDALRTARIDGRPIDVVLEGSSQGKPGRRHRGRR